MYSFTLRNLAVHNTFRLLRPSEPRMPKLDPRKQDNHQDRYQYFYSHFFLYDLSLQGRHHVLLSNSIANVSLLCHVLLFFHGHPSHSHCHRLHEEDVDGSRNGHQNSKGNKGPDRLFRRIVMAFNKSVGSIDGAYRTKGDQNILQDQYSTLLRISIFPCLFTDERFLSSAQHRLQLLQ